MADLHEDVQKSIVYVLGLIMAFVIGLLAFLAVGYFVVVALLIVVVLVAMWVFQRYQPFSELGRLHRKHPGTRT